MDLVAADLRDDVDEWIFTQVQTMDEQGATQSECTAGLRLRFPRLKGMEFRADSAWLELADSDTDEELIPMVLRLRGLRLAKTLALSLGQRPGSRRPKKRTRTKPAFSPFAPTLDTVAEDLEDAPER
jgi:hypothetical protein